MLWQCVRGLAVLGKQIQFAAMKTNLYPFEGHSLLRVGPDLVAAVNEKAGAVILTESSLRDSIQVGLVTRSGRKMVLPTIRLGKARYSSVEAVLEFGAAVARADAEVVVQR